MKVTETTEQVIIYRNEEDRVIGMVLEEDHINRPLFTSYHEVTGGYKWLDQSRDKEHVVSKARERFFFHYHYCPVCGCQFECDRGYECADPEKEETCEECGEQENGSSGKKRLEYQGYLSLRLHISGEWSCPSSRAPGERLDMFANARWDGAGYRIETGAQEWTKEFCVDEGYIAASGEEDLEQAEDSHLEMEYEARTDLDSML